MNDQVLVHTTANAIRQAQRQGLAPAAQAVIHLAAKQGRVTRLPHGRVLRLLDGRAVEFVAQAHPDLSTDRLEKIQGAAVITRDEDTLMGVRRVVLTILHQKEGSLRRLRREVTTHRRRCSQRRQLRQAIDGSQE